MKTLKLENYQEEAKQWLLTHDRGALFASMGLGKTAATLSALDFLFCTGEIKSALIVAPLRVARLTWPNEIQKWSRFQYMKCINLRSPGSYKSLEKGQADVYTINYESLPKLCNHPNDFPPFDVVIFDELTKAKNPNSKRIKGKIDEKRIRENDEVKRKKYEDDGYKLITQAPTGELIFRKRLKGISDLKKDCKYLWGLTGTPITNGYLDLYGQLETLGLAHLIGGTLTNFRKMYFTLDPRTNYTPFKKYLISNEKKKELNQILSTFAKVQHAKDYLNIPPTETIDVDVTLPAESMKRYKQMEKDFLTKVKDDTTIEAKNKGAALMKLTQITSGFIYDENKQPHFLHTSKLEALEKIVKEHDEPILIGCYFTAQYEMLKDYFSNVEKFEDKKSSFERWNRGEIKLMCSHPESIGHGLNFQEGGRIIVWFSLNYNLEQYSQFNARLARKEQDKETIVYRLLVKNSVDEAMAETLRNKDDDQDGCLETIKHLQKISDA